MRDGVRNARKTTAMNGCCMLGPVLQFTLLSEFWAEVRTAKEEGSRSSPQSLLRLLSQLELERERELQLTRSWSRALAGDRAGRLNVSAGVARVDVVEGVDGVHAELHRRALPDAECLLQRQIDVVEVWSKVRVAANIADLVQTRLAERAAKRLRLVEGPSGPGHKLRQVGGERAGSLRVARHVRWSAGA